MLHVLNEYSSNKLILTILKAYAGPKANALLATRFDYASIEIIKENENINNTPIYAALLNWMMLGNFDDLCSLLEVNLKSIL